MRSNVKHIGKVLLVALLSFVFCFQMVLASSFYDNPSFTMGSSGSFNQCVWTRFNSTTDISVTGISKNTSGTPTRAFFMMGIANVDPGNTGNCGLSSAAKLANCTFSGDTCTFNQTVNVTAGTNFTIAIDNNNVAWTQRFSGVAQMPVNGNTTIIRWLGGNSDTGGTAVDGLPRTINGVFFTTGILATDSVQYSSIAKSSAAPGMNVNYSISLVTTGTISLANVTFGFDNGTGTMVNMTPITLSGTSATVSLQRFVNTSSGATIKYQWYVRATNASATLSNDTPVQSYVTNYTSNGTLNYTKYLLNSPTTGNPVGKVNTTTGYSMVAHGEMSTWEENGTIYQIYHTHDGNTPTTHHLVIVNTTDPFVMNGNEKNILELGNLTFPFMAYTGNESVRINGNLTLFAQNATTGYIQAFTATNPYGPWHDACGAPLQMTGANVSGGNMAVYYHADTGVWDMLLDNVSQGYVDDYWNSTALCSGWKDQAVNANGFGALNSWMSYFNGTYLQYFSLLNGSQGYTNHYARGNALNNMTLVTPDVFAGLPLQQSEVTQCLGTCDWSDQDMLIIPPADTSLFPSLPGGWAFYYLADQNNTFVATDADGRTFYAAHNVSPVTVAAPSTVAWVSTQANITVNHNASVIVNFTLSATGTGTINYTSNDSIFTPNLTTGQVLVLGRNLSLTGIHDVVFFATDTSGTINQVVRINVTNTPTNNTWGVQNRTANHNYFRNLGYLNSEVVDGCNDPDGDYYFAYSNDTILNWSDDGVDSVALVSNFTIATSGIHVMNITCSDGLTNTSFGGTFVLNVTNVAPTAVLVGNPQLVFYNKSLLFVANITDQDNIPPGVLVYYATDSINVLMQFYVDGVNVFNRTNLSGTNGLYQYNITVGNYSQSVSVNVTFSVNDTVLSSSLNDGIVMGSSVSNVSCPSVFPNEDDLPGVAVSQLNLTVSRQYGAQEQVVGNMSLGASTLGESCLVVSNDTQNTNYACNATVHYSQAAGTYVASVLVNNTAGNSTVYATTCAIGQLLASKRSTLAITFPAALPGVGNASGDQPLIVRNTGNVPFNESLTAFNLVGRTTPSAILNVSYFLAGVTLGSAVQLQHNVSMNLSPAVLAGNGSQGTTSFWLSMPVGQVVQEYYTPTPWSLVVTG